MNLICNKECFFLKTCFITLMSKTLENVVQYTYLELSQNLYLIIIYKSEIYKCTNLK